MSNSEFKARALYDFVAEGPNELSFNANDILTITSSTAGHGWWYAKNSSEKVGVIPENYVQALADPPEPNEPPPPPPPMSTFANSNNNYPNLDVFNSNNNVAKSSFPPPYDQHQYMNPNTYNNWQAPEQPAWQAPSSPSYQLNEEKLTKPIQPLIFPMDFEINSTNTRTRSDTSHDGYITIVDIVSTPDLIPNMNSNPLYKRNSASDQSEELYEIIPKTPGSMLSNTNFVHKFSFDFPKTSTIQQQTTPFDDYLIPTSIQQQTPAYISIDNDPSRLNRTDTTNTITPSVSVEPSSLINSYDPTSTKLQIATSMPESTIASLKKKKKRNFAGFLTLSRKSKNINPVETTGQAGKRDTDSDDSFSDSEYPPHSSNNQNAPTLKTNSGAPQESRTSLAGFENTKAPPRARFFDKHGLDSYLLNGTKGKSSDEHVEITFDDREGGVCWAPNITIPPFTCKIEEPSKGTKLGGLKAFMEYKIQAQTPGSRIVGRRYKQFDWLHEQLVNKFRFICIPPLPGKQIAGRFEQEFIEERRRQLELWLNRICRHPVLCASFPVQHFVTCELTEKHNKDWKAGKRRIEKDDFREASWLQCVSLKNTGLSDSNIVSQIDTFSQQQPGLESQLKNLSQGLTKYVERHTEVYERDIQRIGELYSKVHQAVQLDTKTPGNKDLSHSIQAISTSYNDIAALYGAKGIKGLRDFNERIQEYIGLLACFPSILSIQRSATEFMRTVQQRGQTDLANALHRNLVLNHVVLAEINYFQNEKVNDLNNYLKALVDEQIQFYENIVSELRTSSATFK
ncbi:unnamed protein product [Adineta steineri]|uniref:Sorting nexin n=1 Tax=Adineta steineri TaxID=433720 RepID=A0A818NWS9_9BILA|nr:unnamed protein product [Adineta steineri]